MNKRIIVCIIFLLVAGSSSLSAEEYKQNYFWTNLGFGSTNVPGEHLHLIAMNLELTKQLGYNYISLRGIFFGRAFSEGGFDKGTEIGLLYGREFIRQSNTSSSFYFSAAIGVSVTRMRVDYDMVNTIGLPIEAKAVFRVSKKTGIGLYHYWNINAQQTYYGTHISLFYRK